MREDYGCDPQDILAAIGPGIGPCCFETHADVPDGLRAELGPDGEAFITALPGGEKFRVNLKEANVCWLLRAGLAREHIAVSDACTACNRTDFWSHRMQGTQRGSMAAILQMV